MSTRQTASVNDLSALIGDWARHLRARNLSARTISSYRQTGQAFAAYLAEQGMPNSIASSAPCR
jgi:site-specific recombinase XerD